MPKSKVLTFKAYCLMDHTDAPEELPTLYLTKEEAIEDNTSYHGSPYDDPLVRGVMCECAVTVTMPPLPKLNKELSNFHIAAAGCLCGLQEVYADEATQKLDRTRQQQKLRRIKARLRKAAKT